MRRVSVSFFLAIACFFLSCFGSRDEVEMITVVIAIVITITIIVVVILVIFYDY